MEIENWISQVRKGILELFILNVLKQKEYYGYNLVKKLVSISGLNAKEGTIYPLLSRLKKQNLIKSRYAESNEGPVRKYYSLTNDGYKVVEKMNLYFESLLEGMETLKNQGE